MNKGQLTKIPASLSHPVERPGFSPAPPPGMHREGIWPTGPSAGRDNRLLLATATVRLPDRTWTGPFSRRHPHVVVEWLGGSEIGRGRMVADHWVSGLPAGRWTREIASFPDVFKVEALTQVGDGCLYRVRLRPPPVVELYQRLEMPLPFPIHIHAGFVRWEVVARGREFAALLRFARDVDPGVRVAWTRAAPIRAHVPLFSPRQQTLLHRAIKAGYFAVPRRISLQELARQSNRSKAAVSEALALIEKKLLESALREPIFSGQQPRPG